MSDELLGLSVVIPVYNSAAVVGETTHRLMDSLVELGRPFEVILVEDGSPDESWSVVEELAESHAAVQAIRLHRNYGQHNATLCGIRHASMPLIVTIDDDLQNPPDQITLLLEQLTDSVDLVYGYAVAERQTRWRNLASRFIKSLLSRAFGGRLHTNHSAFRLFRRSLVPALSDLSGPHISIDAALTWGAGNTVAIPVRFDERFAGQSSYTFRSLIRHVLTMITGYSTAPLRLLSAVGVVAGSLGFGLLCYALASWALRGAQPGFTFLASALSLFAGLQLFGLGLLGEYIGEIHFRTMGMGPYSIRSTVGMAQNSDAPIPKDG